MYTLDTNILIYYLDNELPARKFLKKQVLGKIPLFVSTATEHELYCYSRLTPSDAADIEHVLDMFTLMNINSQIARISAQLRRAYKMKPMDSFIAATAAMTKTTLVTRNVKDVRRIKEISIHAI